MLSAAALQGKFERGRFNEPIVKVAECLVPASIDLWKRIQAKMLPTPDKCHYLFTLHDLSKVGFLFTYCAKAVFLELQQHFAHCIRSFLSFHPSRGTLGRLFMLLCR